MFNIRLEIPPRLPKALEHILYRHRKQTAADDIVASIWQFYGNMVQLEEEERYY